jgi:glycopeptide antibiotics resistance protein
VPLRGIGNLLLGSVWWQVPFVQIGGNVALFVPGGVLLAWRARWSTAQVVAAGVALALGIEVLQYVLGAGVASVDDLILAGVGTLLGALPVAAYRRWKAPRVLIGAEVTSTASYLR